MNAQLPPTLARALVPMAPPQSVVHQIVREDQAQRIDAAMHKEKLVDGWFQRECESAMRLQQQRQDLGGGV